MICAASALVLRQKKIEEVLLERVCHWRCWMGENPPELISYIHILHNIRLKCDKIKTIAIAKTLNRAVRAAQVVHKLLLQGRSAHSEVFLPFLCPQTYHISSDSDLIQLYGLFYYCYYYYCYYYCIGHSWEKESEKRSTKLLRGGERSWNDAFRRTRRETSRFFFYNSEAWEIVSKIAIILCWEVGGWISLLPLLNAPPEGINSRFTAVYGATLFYLLTEVH